MQNDTWIAAAHMGTSLRVWVHAEGGVTPLLAQVGGTVTEAALLELIHSHLRPDAVTPVICAGLDVAGFVPVPAPPPNTAVAVESGDPRIALLAVQGLSQQKPADLMGAQAVQVAGFVDAFPDWDGVLCLTGPQSRWVHISAGEVVSFQTYLTGEMFGLLGRQSVLGEAVQSAAQDEAAFAQAVSDAMSRPERVAGALYSLHAAVRAGAARADARGRLSGMLIGTELAAARPYWLGQNVALIGEGGQVARYGAALQAQGVPAQIHDAAEMTLRGLQLVRAKLV